MVVALINSCDLARSVVTDCIASPTLRLITSKILSEARLSNFDWIIKATARIEAVTAAGMEAVWETENRMSARIDGVHSSSEGSHLAEM